MNLFLLILVTTFLSSFCEVQEEFHAHGPLEFHDVAMKTFLEMRKADPTQNLSYEGEFLTRANKHAIKRLSRKPDEAYSLRKTDADGKTAIGSSGTILQLPSPDGKDSYLTAAVHAQSANGADGQVILVEEAKAMAVVFNEEIGLGAISKAGALPMGAAGEWLELAEDKLKKDASLDYHALLWEIGSEVAESRFNENGGMNITYENEILDKMEAWFIKGGGKIHFSKPNVSKESGFKLIATEDVHEMDAVVTMPMKLIMCKQTARNVVISNRGKYLGEELAKTFEKNELWGMAIFLLHEYYKEINGNGSKWGPYIRTLRMRYLSTPVLQSLEGTIAVHMSNQWLKGSDSFMWWSVGSDGPCSPTTHICKTKPLDKMGDSRFNIHQIRWAYWVVKQNAVKVKQISTGLEFVALIPYYNMFEKKHHAGGGITFDLDGTVAIRAGKDQEEGIPLSIHPGNYSDAEFFLRYLSVPKGANENNEIKLTLPGAIPKGSKFHYCMKGTYREQNKDECKGAFKSESMFWKSKVLTEWRQTMNLPPRLQELRMWATRLHLYGGAEEMALISNANQLIAGLPIPVDQMPAEEQLMLMGVARDNIEAALIATGPAEKIAPQLYMAPDPEEDHEARRSMENLALLAVQAQNVMSSGNMLLNATQVVLNATRDFFQHGVLPMAGLDALDMFLLKKIGMLAHCGFENDMKITMGNVTQELMCAMRVHLMNESEIHVFCPKDALVWEENCLNVEFMNFTAISEPNEMSVINALRNSIYGLLASYPTTSDDDKALIERAEADTASTVGPILLNSYYLRFREKQILHDALQFLEVHEQAVLNGSVPFQLELKAMERLEANLREEAHKKYLEEVKRRATVRPQLAFVEVDMGDKLPKANLTLEEGRDIRQTVTNFCKKHSVQLGYVDKLEQALRARIVNPPPYKLLLGVVVASGDRLILGIPDAPNVNSTVETGVFCTKNSDELTKDPASSGWCKALIQRVENRLNVPYPRKILVAIPIDAPDGRKLQLIVREGEQHDILQFTADFFQYYNVPFDSVQMVANEVLKRLPPVEVQVPVSMASQRQVVARFSRNDNITTVVAAFANFFEIDDAVKIAIMKRARYGMAPGTFLV